MNPIKSVLDNLKPGLILLYLSSTGFLGIFSVQYYLKLKFDPIICLCFMGLIFGIYTFNRFTDAQEDFANDIGKFIFFQNRKGFFMLAIASIALTLATLIFLEKLNGWHAGLILTGFFYSYRAIPWFTRKDGFHLIRLKEIVFVKNVLVSFWWPASLLAFPIYYSDQAFTEAWSISLIAIALFIATLNNTLFHDIMDESGDRHAGIKTLPSIWGSKSSYALLWSLDAIWIFFVIGLYFLDHINGALGCFLGLLTLYPAFYLACFFSGRFSRTAMEFLTESDVVLFSFGLILLARG